MLTEQSFLSAVGMRLDIHRSRRPLGSGGMSVVYEADHRELGRVVALKLLLPELCEDGELVARFLDEATFLRALTGPHVVRLLDAGYLENGTPFLSLERLSGRDLSLVIRACGRLATPVAVDYTMEACAGLAEAHDRGIIHCDVKSANLFVAGSPSGLAQIKVLDFGVAEWSAGFAPRHAASTGRRGLMGSPAYCSPEQLAQSERLDARTDIWSLGLVLFEMLTGIRPFAQTTLGSIRARLQQPAPRLCVVRPDIEPRLSAVVETCLQQDRNRRFASMQELADALRPFSSARRRRRGCRGSLGVERPALRA